MSTQTPHDPKITTLFFAWWDIHELLFQFGIIDSSRRVPRNTVVDIAIYSNKIRNQMKLKQDTINCDSDSDLEENESQDSREVTDV